MSIKPFLELFDWLSGKRKPKPVIPNPGTNGILIVEDNYDDAQLLLACLKYHNLTATVALTAEAAQALIDRNNIKLMFVDMRLTYMNGWELIPIVWRKSPHTIVVAVCGLLEDLPKIKSNSGIVTVMQKPPTVALIKELIAKLRF